MKLMTGMRLNCGALALAIALTAASASAAPFSNGDFDDYTGTLTNNQPINTFAPVSWVPVGDVSQVTYKDFAPGLTAQSGAGYLGFFDGGGGNNGASQTFDTVMGETYGLTFYAATQLGSGHDFNVDVFDGLDFTGTNLTGGDDLIVIDWAAGTWEQQTLSFTAASTTTTLRFQEVGTSGAGDVFLDTVVLQAGVVPNDPKPVLEIDRANGSLSLLNNTGSPVGILGYSITSPTAALDSANWLSIAANYDADGDTTVDANDAWTELSNGSGSDLSEAELVGGDGATLIHGQVVNLGIGAWLQHPTIEDLGAELLLSDGTIQNATVRYIGDALIEGDLDFDGDIDAADWQLYRGGFASDLSGLSGHAAYVLGDLDGDGMNDTDDFHAFKGLYDALNGPGSFEAMASAVPEPSALLLLMLGGMASVLLRGERRGQRG